MTIVALAKKAKVDKPARFSVGRERFVVYKLAEPTLEEKSAIRTGKLAFRKGKCVSGIADLRKLCHP